MRNYNQNILYEKRTCFQLTGNKHRKMIHQKLVEINPKLWRVVHIQVEKALCSNENSRTIKQKINILKEKQHMIHKSKFIRISLDLNNTQLNKNIQIKKKCFLSLFLSLNINNGKVRLCSCIKAMHNYIFKLIKRQLICKHKNVNNTINEDKVNVLEVI